MSAPQTNIERQKKRHRGPLFGMAAVVAVGLALILGLSVGLTDDGLPVPAEAPTVAAD